MGLMAKTFLVTGLALFAGTSAALWQSYGGKVYAAYLSGAPMFCL